MQLSDLPEQLNDLSREVVDSFFSVHKMMGPGLLERIYEDCLICELQDRKISFERQKAIQLNYKTHKIPTEYKIDLIIENQIIVELKCVERLIPVHEAQIISYMKLSQIPLGFLVNFNTPLIKDGIKRVVLSNFASSRLRG